MVLFLMNPYWFWWIRESMTSCSLFATSFVINFRTELRSEMGL
uniref:Uncharacterized protein n=1 Tax=Arundo donax TaxID=35708 RepID=A0A0A9A5Q9_ARUDO